MTALIPFDNSFMQLPAVLHVRMKDRTAPSAPRLLAFNRPLAAELGLDVEALDGPAGAEVFSGARLPQGAEPAALAYAGHQFGHFVPQLGDGRALLLGEVLAPGGQRFDIQLKGSGPTPFSRGGDGYAALGPVLREYIVSEAMAALAIPTTRALAAVATGDMVYRDTLLPGAVFARVASSHIRVGTFQYLAARGDIEELRRLADYAMARHDPEAMSAPRPVHAFLSGVVDRQAKLVARWLLVGFVHGVMNTDNMTVSGETIDYGPCAFLDAYDPAKVFSSIDRNGRYAYANQPGIAQWNLTRLAECLLPFLADSQEQAIEEAQDLLAGFASAFNEAYETGLRQKIGLTTRRDDDRALAQDLLGRMAVGGADFTLTFRRLGDAAVSDEADDAVRSLFADPAAYDAWAVRWRERLDAEGGENLARRDAMRQVNPAYIPRNHRVEEAIAAAVGSDDLGPFERLVGVLAKPFDDQAGKEMYGWPPAVVDPRYRTFCGT